TRRRCRVEFWVVTGGNCPYRHIAIDGGHAPHGQDDERYVQRHGTASPHPAAYADGHWRWVDLDGPNSLVDGGGHRRDSHSTSPSIEPLAGHIVWGHRPRDAGLDRTWRYG